MINDIARKSIHVDSANNIPIATVKEYDDFILKLALMKYNTPFDCTGQTVTLAVMAPSGLFEQSTDITIKGNQIDIKLKKGIVSKAGTCSMEPKLVDSTGSMTTASFFIAVNRKILNDEAVEASDEFDTLTKAVTKVEEDYKGLKKIMIDENNAANLQNQVNQTNAQLADNVQLTEVAHTNPTMLWKSPSQPKGQDIIFNSPWGPEKIDLFYAKYDELCNEFPEYVRSEIIGYDQSGLYPIKKYVFEPKRYEKTVLFSSLIHAGELVGYRGLLRTMQHICRDYKKYPQLSYLRNMVKIVVVPIINVHGMTTGKRENSRGVDLNRNFPYRWTNKGVNYGESAGSEAETKAMIKVVNDENPSLVIDFHCTENRILTNEVYCSVSAFEKSNTNKLIKVINTIFPNAKKQLHYSYEPMFYNWCVASKKINALTIEWVPGSFHEAGSELDIEDCMNLFVNSILQLIGYNVPNFENICEPQVYNYVGGFITKSTTSTSWVEMDFTRLEIPPQFKGIVELTASLTYANSDETAQNFFTCAFSQRGNPMYDVNYLSYLSEVTQQTRNEILTSGGSRQQCTLIASGIVVNSSNTLAISDNLFIKFFWKTTAGTLGMRRIKILVKLTPSESIKPYRLIEENSSGVYTEVYPSGLY